MFRMVFPSIIRSSRLYIHHQVYVTLHVNGHEMELFQFHLVPVSMQCDIYLMMYVQSWTSDDGRKDHPKHVEWYSISSNNCASSRFYYRKWIILEFVNNKYNLTQRYSLKITKLNIPDSQNILKNNQIMYVQSWTSYDGRKDRPKHVEWYSISSINCASSWFYYRNISRCTVPWTSNFPVRSLVV